MGNKEKMGDILNELGRKYDFFDYAYENVFKKFSDFLDNIPDKNKREIAKEILKILIQYNRAMTKFLKYEEENEEREELNLPKAKIVKNETYNKIKKDLTIAENFRKSLESFEEMKRRTERLNVLDTNLTHLPPHLEAQADFILNYRLMENLVNKPKLNYEIIDNTSYQRKDPYFKMVELVDKYISDLNNYLIFGEDLEMAKIDKYIDRYTKPNRGELRRYLLEICKTFNLKNCVNNAKELVIQLNKNC